MLREGKTNLTPLRWKLMLQLKNHNVYIVVQGDKNLGPCILERRLYIEQAFLEYLGNDLNYRQTSKERTFRRQKGLQIKFCAMLSKYCEREH